MAVVRLDEQLALFYKAWSLVSAQEFSSGVSPIMTTDHSRCLSFLYINH